jgi:crotonobetainyl-CoA:carnitine CoA-transferase CaiB-like acyl-CoA transferase
VISSVRTPALAWAVRLSELLSGAGLAAPSRSELEVELGTRSQSSAEGWRRSGLLAMCSPERPARTLLSAADLPAAADGAAAVLAALARSVRRELSVDGAALLGERAAIAGLRSRTGWSAGGGARVLAADDGWVAIGLRRPEDEDLVPALVSETLSPGAGLWSGVAAWVAGVPAADAVGRAQLLGLSAAQLPTPSTMPDGDGTGRGPDPWTIEPLGKLPGHRPGPTTAPRVADLSTLWAGPLAARLLLATGAEVTKLETAERPDGARRGDLRFYEALNRGKRDLVAPAGSFRLDDCVAASDVVITSARPRALERLGWVPRPSQTWITITGHGWSGPRRDWVGFGDEVAAGAGLWAGDPERPEFCGDAVADPLTGLHAAVVALASVVSGVAVHADISLHSVSAAVAGGRSGPPSPIAAPPTAEPAHR